MVEKSGLRLESVSVTYPGNFVALDNIDLTVAPGEIVALLGPSGSGKSTLLRAVAGLERLSKGRLLWNGQDISNVAPHKRGFGFMFQDGQLFTHKTVGENVEYGLKVQKVAAESRKMRVAELLNKVGLSGFEGRSVTTLSGGQAQRVALARALAPEPVLLMLDEPLSSLDKELRGRLAEDLDNALRESGTSAILVTHDAEEAESIADRVTMLSEGRLLDSLQ